MLRSGWSRRPRLTYANVVATVALFGVLAGGGAYAQQRIGSAQIKKNAVKSKHIAKNAVKARQAATGTLRPALGIRTRGPLEVAVGQRRVLARSGPITLAGMCFADTASLVIRSRTGTGRVTAIRYSSGTTSGTRLDLTAADAELAGAGPVSPRGVSLIAAAGRSTLSGEAELAVVGARCEFSFSGLGG